MNKAQKAALKDIIIRESAYLYNNSVFNGVLPGAHRFNLLYYLYTDGIMGLFMKKPVPDGIEKGTKTEEHALLEKVADTAVKYIQKPWYQFALDTPLTLEKCKKCVSAWERGADITESVAPKLQFSASWKDKAVNACYNADFLEGFLTLLPPEKTEFFVTSEPFGHTRASILVGVPKDRKEFAPCGFLLPTKPDKFAKSLSDL